MSEKFRLDRKIGFQNTFYTKCINVIIDSIGPSIILRSIDSEFCHNYLHTLYLFAFCCKHMLWLMYDFFSANTRTIYIVIVSNNIDCS